jgi:hypothetical protein
VSLTNVSNVRNRASTATPSVGTPVELTGDFGSAAPRLASFDVTGEGAADTVYGTTPSDRTSPSMAPVSDAHRPWSSVVLCMAGAGDVFIVTFDKVTDRGGVRGGKQYVDSLFTFTQPIGVDYSGGWLDASTFEVVLLNTGPVSSIPVRHRHVYILSNCTGLATAEWCRC